MIITILQYLYPLGWVASPRFKVPIIMYNCYLCGKIVPPRTPCHKLTKTRIFHHPYRARVQKRWVFDKNGKWKMEWRDDKGGVGTQIVSEKTICPECAAVVAHENRESAV